MTKKIHDQHYEKNSAKEVKQAASLKLRKESTKKDYARQIQNYQLVVA